MEISKLLDNQLFIRVLILILAFTIIIVSVSSIKIDQMGTGDFYVESVLPLPYWIGVAIIALVGLFSIKFLENHKYVLLIIFTSILLIVAFRIAFPIMFTSVPGYEPDAINYINVVTSWVNTQIDFGYEGNYQHDYPLAFLIAFVFIKLGAPSDFFFRAAPFIIYALEILFFYLLIKEVTPSPINNKIAAVSVFLFSFSSLGYWVTVHYCPDLIGSFFFFVALYFGLRFAKTKNYSIRTIVPVLLSIILLVLSHHLSALYFLLAMIGLSLSTWFFKSPQIEGKAISFFLLGIFTYTFWFAYGTLIYPSFFKIYSYFGGGGFGSPTGLAQQAGILNNISFAIYPVFIIGLFLYDFIRTTKLRPRNLIFFRSKLRELRINERENLPFVFTMGFILLLGLFFVGFALPVSFPQRVLEVLCIGFSPLASHTFIQLNEGKMSKKKLAILIVILLFVVLTGVHRYYSQIQRRVLIG